jgi:hypothetical protein
MLVINAGPSSVRASVGFFVCTRNCRSKSLCLEHVEVPVVSGQPAAEHGGGAAQEDRAERRSKSVHSAVKAVRQRGQPGGDVRAEHGAALHDSADGAQQS